MTARLAKKIIRGHALGIRTYRLHTVLRAMWGTVATITISWCLLTCLLLTGCTQPLVVETEKPASLKAEIDPELAKQLAALHDKLDHQQVPPAPQVNVDMSALDKIAERLDQLPTKADLIESSRVKAEGPASAVKGGAKGVPDVTSDAPVKSAVKGGAPVVSEVPLNTTADGRLIIYWQSRPNCEPCKTWLAEGGDVRIDSQPIWWEPMAKSPKDFQVDGFPFFAWRDASGGWWTFSGWFGVEAFEAKVLKANSGQIPRETSRVAAPVYGRVAVAAPVVRTVAPLVYAAPVTGYPVRGSWWTGCNSWVHLTQGEHAGKFSTAWLQSLTWEQTQSLHSDDHEGRVQWTYVVRPGQSLRRTAGSTALYGSTTVYGDSPVLLAAPVHSLPTMTRTRTTTGLFGLPMTSRTVTRQSCPNGICPPQRARGWW